MRKAPRSLDCQDIQVKGRECRTNKHRLLIDIGERRSEIHDRHRLNTTNDCKLSSMSYVALNDVSFGRTAITRNRLMSPESCQKRFLHATYRFAKQMPFRPAQLKSDVEDRHNKTDSHHL
jgi:hypothetical protein